MFEEYNEKYFGGKLGYCKILLVNRPYGTYGSYMTFKNKRLGRYGYIVINKGKMHDMEEVKNTLIHEMIHMYNRFVDGPILGNPPINGLFGHGFFFRRQCWRLKRKYGIKIDIIPKEKKS